MEVVWVHGLWVRVAVRRERVSAVSLSLSTRRVTAHAYDIIAGRAARLTRLIDRWMPEHTVPEDTLVPYTLYIISLELEHTLDDHLEPELRSRYSMPRI